MGTTPYNADAFRPPAPVASVVVRSPATGARVENVAMLLDTGADISFLPRTSVANLLDEKQLAIEYEVEAFDGAKSLASMVQLEVEFLGKLFRGQFLLLDSRYGILGRNILNNVSLLFDGPRRHWNESRL